MSSNNDGSPMHLREAIICVSCVALFADLSPEQIEAIAHLCEQLELKQGEYLATEGEPADDFFILLDGEVLVSKKLHLPSIENVDNEDRILTRLSSIGNPVLGETALVGNTPRLATVRCATDCRFFRLSAGLLQELIQQDSTIGSVVYLRLCQMIYQRLESANTDVVKLSAALVFALEGA